MKSNYTHLAILIDRSGSMTSIENDVINGLDNLINEQKKVDGECTISIMQFDHEMEYITNFSDLKTFDFEKERYKPRSTTALVDSMVTLIKDTGKKLASLSEDERPSRVMFVVVTDGEENASKEYTSEDLKKLVTEHTDVWKWDFTYIGANQDSFATAKNYGISLDAVLNYNATERGTSKAFMTVNSVLSRSRAGGQSVSYTTDEVSDTENTI